MGSETVVLVPLRDAEGVSVEDADAEPVEAAATDLVVVADYGDTIYPGTLRLVIPT